MVFGKQLGRDFSDRAEEAALNSGLFVGSLIFRSPLFVALKSAIKEKRHHNSKRQPIPDIGHDTLAEFELTIEHCRKQNQKTGK